jgi:hypothetical protein
VLFRLCIMYIIPQETMASWLLLFTTRICSPCLVTTVYPRRLLDLSLYCKTNKPLFLLGSALFPGLAGSTLRLLHIKWCVIIPYPAENYYAPLLSLHRTSITRSRLGNDGSCISVVCITNDRSSILHRCVHPPSSILSFGSVLLSFRDHGQCQCQ